MSDSSMLSDQSPCYKDTPGPLTFNLVDAATAQAIIEAAAPFIEPAVYPEGQTMVQVAELPFYEAVKLYSLSDTTLPQPNTRYVFHSDGMTVPHDWTNEHIYSLNENLPLLLNEETIIPYVRFFFHFVRGQLGRFIFVENVEDICWLPDAPAEEKAALESELMPLSYRGLAPDGMLTLVATVVFKNALFRTNVKIAPQAMDYREPETDETVPYTLGQMLLCNEELLLEDLHIVQAPPPGEFG